MARARAVRPLSPSEEAVVRQAWAAGLSRAEVADAAGISISRLDETKRAIGLPSRQGLGGGPKRRSAYRDPTPDEIAERSAAVRAGWSLEEAQVRNGYCPMSQRVPTSPRAYLRPAQLDISMLVGD